MSNNYDFRFVANHLGHFLLTNLLLDKLKASAPSRIIVVASTMHDPTKGKRKEGEERYRERRREMGGRETKY